MKILKFYAEWCGPCKALSQVIKNAGDKVTIPVEEVNIDENLFMSQHMNIRSVPTMVIIDNDEKEVKRHIGYMTEKDLLEFVKEYQ